MDYLKACAELLNNSTQEELEAVLRKTQEEEDVCTREAQEKHVKETIAALQQDAALQSAITLINEPSEVTGDSVFALWDSLKTHIPITELNAGIYQHLIDSAAFAFHLATLQPDLGVSPQKAAFTAILHNAGMLIEKTYKNDPEYYRKAEISFLLATSLKIREDIIHLMLPLELYLTPKNEEGSPRIPTTDDPNDPIILDNARYIQETITPGQLLLEMARLLAKRNSKTKKLMTWEEILDFHQKTRAGVEGYRIITDGKHILWPRAKAALQDIEASRLAASYSGVYLQAFNALTKSGFDHTAIAAEIDSAEPDTDNRIEATANALFIKYLVP